MNIFFTNKDFRQLTINQWISTVGDTIFYLAFINHVSSAPFAPLAIFLISLSETAPQILQIFTGVIADFQSRRIFKYSLLTLVKFLLYFLVALLLAGTDFSISSVLIICLINLVSDTLGFFSGAMLTPIYIKIIRADMASAMGFRQATLNLVRTLSNLAGGLALGFISIELLALINALTFLLSFLGILLIRKNLVSYEDRITIQAKPATIKNFWKHLIDSSKKLLQFHRVMKLFVILSISQAVLSVTTPIVTLLLIKQPFLGLKTGQALALMTTLELLGLIAGNLFSGNLFKNISSKASLYAGQLMEGLLLIGFFSNNFPLITFAVFGDALVTGITSPRLQAAVFGLIPEEDMGVVQSAVGTITIVLPSLLAIFLVSVATSLGVLAVSLALGALLLLGLYLLKNFDGLPS
ncbi:hypothetical protein [Streptococcus oricebi]|uniref:MFS transporter n=1 Tax=Streptococcus oricebi TaxID=1547447 RepID=A0ABS5B515_9STRE|nr:hypothetical protein [Streptococcus oricebi]MBP2623927.1 hypothetical protein [Streptococcus oricebi]